MVSTLIFGSTDFTPALKPASNCSITSPGTPPTKPTCLAFDFSAAATPTRKEPSRGGEDQVVRVLQRRLGQRGAVAVDDREVGVRVLLGDLGGRRRVEEPDRDDRVEASLGERAQPLLAVGVVLVGRGLGLDAGGVELLDGLVRPA